VKGNIVSSTRLELSATAKVTGNIKAPILIVNEGATLKGKCQVPAEDEKK
ncbi:polymer-forming cytoskeletal protein, partial [Candidatus Woesearchaeota archaeon]|nr:polymer-forming cytoskeletal protein [Candidatus Woesearchaeota archaeon]